jgi:hypothetical protein
MKRKKYLYDHFLVHATGQVRFLPLLTNEVSFLLFSSPNYSCQKHYLSASHFLMHGRH